METGHEISALKQEFATRLNDFYNGDPWVTENFESKVSSLSATAAMKAVQGHSHSVSELLGHIIAWRNFALQKLTGNDSYFIEINSSVDWPQPKNWDILLKEFRENHKNLLEAIKNFPDAKWNSKVPGKDYSFAYLINGIIEHDYYHYGQIGSVLSEIKRSG